MADVLLDRIEKTLLETITNHSTNFQIPQAVFWFDKEGVFKPAITKLASRFFITTLGPYSPYEWQGPAIYLRCLVSRTLPGIDEKRIPVIYIPGYNRQELKDVKNAPEELKPLADYFFRSKIFGQKGGKDWKIFSLIESCTQITFDSSSSKRIHDTLTSSFDELLEIPVSILEKNSPLTADRINNLLVSDFPRQILKWMNEGKVGEGTLWNAFCEQSKSKLKINPQENNLLEAAKQLGQREDIWAEIWDRFSEHPVLYPRIEHLLRSVQFNFIPLHKDSWPQINDDEENKLRSSLIECAHLLPNNARKKILELEKEHGKRRTWVWSNIGNCPLANALLSLTNLCAITQNREMAGTITEQNERYRSIHYYADIAVINSLNAVTKSDDIQAISSATRSVYVPWLIELIEAYQSEWQKTPPSITPPNFSKEPSKILMFVDGLRYDIATLLAEELKNQNCTTNISTTLTAIPTMTETAKPFVMPLPVSLISESNLSLRIPEGGIANATSLRNLLKNDGWEIVEGDAFGDISKPGWTEFGNLDTLGHTLGLQIIKQLSEIIRSISERVIQLLNNGWKEVVVITDHGWLLIPGGLPKTELNVTLTEIKKGRCAILKPAVGSDFFTVPYYWDTNKSIAVAPDLHCFEEGKEYEHGGISPQEIIIPILSVKAMSSHSEVKISSIKWVNLRCEVKGIVPPGAALDIREIPIDSKTSLSARVKDFDIEGKTSVTISDDIHEGKPAYVVILDENGVVIAQMETKIGE